MILNNSVMLITYADCMGKDLKDLGYILDRYFEGAIGGVHILPFFPSSADRGFAPVTYQSVDPDFGDWQDIKKLSERYYLMFDFMVNHISASSEYFKDFVKNKDNSKYKNLFIRYKDFWQNGEPTEEEVDKIYKRKPRAPYVDVTFPDNSTEKLWCTFNEEQIDLNCYHPFTKNWIRDNLEFLSSKGASIIRLDAFAYATKKAGTSCFFLEPDVWEILGECEDVLNPLGCKILPEIHEHYTMQLKVAEHGYYVYDFALPMLLLHALYTGRSDRLLHWLKICPRKQFTTLDTHDGIGVVDARDLMSDDEIELTKERLYAQGGSVNRKYSTSDYNNLDIYQINCTYYSALGEDDNAYLLARAIQFFAPGIPQVYYVGLFAGKNDVELVEKTKNGRDINRHYYTSDEIENEVKRPLLQKMYRLMKFRNSHPAFSGEVSIGNDTTPNCLEIQWQNGTHIARLNADLISKEFTVRHTGEWEGLKTLDFTNAD